MSIIFLDLFPILLVSFDHSWEDLAVVPEDYVDQNFCNERFQRMMGEFEKLNVKVDLLVLNLDSKINVQDSKITVQDGKIKIAEIDIEQLEKVTAIADAVKKDVQRRNLLTISVTAMIVGILSNLDKIFHLLSKL